MANIAVFPGSFDPITKGHENVVRRALPLFDRIIVAIGHNENKKNLFSIEERMAFIRKTFADTPLVVVKAYEGLTTDFCKRHGANFLLRGIRSIADFKYERYMATVNKELLPNLETVFICTDAMYGHISSSVVREILRHEGDATNFLPDALKGKL